MMVKIACCPEHGLHGERTECFICNGPVEQISMVRESDAAAALTAMRDTTLFAADEYDRNPFPGLSFRDHLDHRLGATAHAYALRDLTQAYRVLDAADALSDAVSKYLADLDGGDGADDAPLQETVKAYIEARRRDA